MNKTMRKVVYVLTQDGTEVGRTFDSAVAQAWMDEHEDNSYTIEMVEMTREKTEKQLEWEQKHREKVAAAVECKN